MEQSTMMVRFDDVCCRFRGADGDVPALDRVSLAIGAGELVAVMGATGSGKSTLLNCAAGLQQLSSGRVHLLGSDLTSMSERALSTLRRDRVGFVFQSYNLLTELTVAQNVLLPCRLGATQRWSLGAALGAVGLAGLEDRRVATLSGGQRQRVALARALVTHAEVVFADEPTGALDPTTGRVVLGLLRSAADAGVTVVMVSHDPVAASISDRLLLLRDGHLVDDRQTPGVAEIGSLLAAVSGEHLVGGRR